MINFKTSPEGLLVINFGDLDFRVYFTDDQEFFIKEYRGYFKFLTDNGIDVTGFLFNGMTAKKVN